MKWKNPRTGTTGIK